MDDPNPRCVTMPVTMRCQLCGDAFVPVGRQRFCTDAHRAAAYRRRRTAARALLVLPAGARRAATTVYECDGCGARAVGRQYCVECSTFMRRVGPGGACPHCDEPVAVVDLIGPEVNP
jgi:hypothetical protein